MACGGGPSVGASGGDLTLLSSLKVGLVVATLGFLLTFPLEASMASRATLTQFVEPDPSGRGFTTIGSPIEILDVPPSAIVQEGGAGLAALVDRARYRRERNGVLTMTEVRRTAQMARLGSLAAILLIGVGLIGLPSLQAPLPE